MAVIPQIVSVTDIEVALGISGTATTAQKQLIALSHGGAEGAVKKHLAYDPVQQTHVEFYPARLALGNSWHGFDTDHHHIDSDGVTAYSSFGTRTDELRKLMVKNIPIRSITEIREDRNARGGSQAGDFPANTVVAATEYFIDAEKTCAGVPIGESGIIWRDVSVWSTTERTIRITYVAGYTENELQGFSDCLDASPIRQATLITAIFMFRQLCAIQKAGQAGFVGPLESERLGDYSYRLGNQVANRLGLFENGALPCQAANLLEEYEHMGLQLI